MLSAKTILELQILVQSTAHQGNKAEGKAAERYVHTPCSWAQRARPAGPQGSKIPLVQALATGKEQR